MAGVIYFVSVLLCAGLGDAIVNSLQSGRRKRRMESGTIRGVRPNEIVAR